MTIINLKIYPVDETAESKYAAEISLRGVMRGEKELLKQVHQKPGITSAMGL